MDDSHPKDTGSGDEKESRPAAENARPSERGRIAAAILIALAGAVAIWAFSPYNDILLRNASLAEGYVPAGALLILLLLILVVNPLMRAARARFVLGRRQLALILGIVLVASSPPSTGLMQSLPYLLAKLCTEARRDDNLLKIYDAMQMPQWLFPDRVGSGMTTRVAATFQERLLPGESIPWGAWAGPGLMWGMLMACAWLLMIGMSLIVLPQWRNNERLSFPLLNVYGALLEEPAAGSRFPPVFHHKGFWCLGGFVLLTYCLRNLDRSFPGSIPVIPMQWNVKGLFTEGVLAQLDEKIYANELSFVIIGMAFFMPSRICFSVWFFSVAWAFCEMIQKAYMPPFYLQKVGDYRTSAVFVMAASILWLGRAHFAHVFACLFRRCKSAEDSRDRHAAAMFLVGAAGMWAWFRAVHVSVGWSAFYVLFVTVVSLVIARFVAETGIPFIRLDFNKRMEFLSMVPGRYLDYPSILIGHFVAILFEWGSRCNAAVLATHAFALSPKESPRFQSRVSFLMILVLCLGFLVSGIAAIHMNYNHDQSLDGIESPLGKWAYDVTLVAQPHSDMLRLRNKAVNEAPYSRPLHMGGAAALAGLLQWASLTMPKWPLHPIGLVMLRTNYARNAWVSLFVGWLLKILIIRYGGARLYRSMFPVIIGMILGELGSRLIWSIVPIVFMAFGIPYVHE